MTEPDAIGALSAAFPGRIRTARLADLTTWRIGGDASVIEADSPGMLEEVTGTARDLGVGVFILGRGSNILASDSGCDGLVIRLSGKFRKVLWQRDGDLWRVEAGASAMLPGLAGASCMKGAAGLEFAVGIPGTVGGAVFMNAGAYGASISELVSSVRFLSEKGWATAGREGCGFGYRTSAFQSSSGIVASVVLELRAGDPAALMESASGILRKRRESFPLRLPNAGSVFRRTEGAPPPGRLIEEAGLKGRRSGGAMISDLHANFIVNTGGASSGDVTDLVGDTRRAVFETSGVSLAEEIRYLGRFGGQTEGR